MDYGRNDIAQLIEPLFSRLLDPCPWQEFLERLASQTRARLGGLRLRGPGGAQLDHWAGPGGEMAVAHAVREQTGAQILPQRLRPLQVYTYAALVDQCPTHLRSAMDEFMTKVGVADGLRMFVPTRSGWDAWIVIESSTKEFTEADSQLLVAIGPFVSHAISLLVELDNRLRRAEIAESSLAALGVTQALLDRDQQVVVDGGAAKAIGLPSGMLKRPSHSRQGDLTQGLALIAAGKANRAVVGKTLRSQPALLLPSPPSDARVALPQPTLVVTRNQSLPAEGARAMSETLKDQFGLSRHEAELAVALAMGESLVAAGNRIGLTRESTRSYSKRIYAKTGTRGQADLVRLVIMSLAPFASHA